MTAFAQDFGKAMESMMDDFSLQISLSFWPRAFNAMIEGIFGLIHIVNVNG